MRPLLIRLVLILTLSSAAFAFDGLEFGLVSGYSFGSSSYFLDANDGNDGVQSLLEFPLDALSMGVEAGYSPPDKRWRIEGSLLTSLTPPASLMLDYDWFYQVGLTPVPFSYTESNIDYRSGDLRISGELPLYRRGEIDLSLKGGYRLFYIDQLATDFRGWQYRDDNTDGEYELYLLDDERDGIDYRITYHIVHAGAGLRLGISPRAELALTAAPALGLFFDRDDHLLRNKLSLGRGFGYGFEGGGALTLRFGEQSDKMSPYLRITGAYSWFYSRGVQDQEWYGDDNGTPAGTRIEGLVHNVTLVDPRLGLSAGFSR